MRLTDGLVLTVVNTIVCLFLPKFIATVFAEKQKSDNLTSSTNSVTNKPVLNNTVITSEPVTEELVVS